MPNGLQPNHPLNGLLSSVNLEDYPFGRRAINPNQPIQENDDGTVSTHLMAAEIDEDGQAWAFPTIIDLGNGNLHRFEDPYEAMKENKRMGNAVPFDSIEKAILWSKNYKYGTPLEQGGGLLGVKR